MPDIEALMSLHNEEAELKGSKLMVQRKGNFHVKDSRSAEERDQEGLDVVTAARMVRAPTAPPGRGIFLLIRLRGQRKVRLSWYHHLYPVREPNWVEEKPLPGQGISFAETSSRSRARGPACWILLGTYSIFCLRSVKLGKLEPFL